MNTATPELTQCGQCKGYFPMASSTPDAQDGLFSHNCSSEPKETRELADTPEWARNSVDAPETGSTGGTGRPANPATPKQVVFILKLQTEKVAVDAMGRKDEHGLSVAQVLDAASQDRKALAERMASAKASKYIDQLLTQPNVVKASDPHPVEATGTAMTELEAADFVRLLGRKLEVDDVTPALKSFAATWAANWTGGDFQFMVDMRDAARSGKFSVGQAKGTLNCFRADVLRATKATPAIPPAGGYEPQRGDVHVIDGRYYRVSEGQNSGRLYVNEWVGSSWEFAKGVIAQVTADNKITADQAAEFGHATNKCVFCTHDLDIDRSITVGYGPKCATKHSLPW